MDWKISHFVIDLVVVDEFVAVFSLYFSVVAAVVAAWSFSIVTFVVRQSVADFVAFVVITIVSVELYLAIDNYY